MNDTQTKQWREPSSRAERIERTKGIAAQLDKLNEKEYDDLVKTCQEQFDQNPKKGVRQRTVDRIFNRVSNQASNKALELLERLLKTTPEKDTQEELVDGLPSDKPDFYEKDILDRYKEEYEKNKNKTWPYIVKKIHSEDEEPNPISYKQIGKYREDSARVVIDARVDSIETFVHGENFPHSLPTLLEAGPRGKLIIPGLDLDELKIGILVSGGIAPGINAVIDGIFSRHELYTKKSRRYSLTVYGYEDGFYGLSQGKNKRVVLNRNDVRAQAHLGGSIICTARYSRLSETDDWKDRQNLLCNLVHQICDQQLRILYIIGGDGSMRCAHVLSTYARHMLDKEQIDYLPVIVGVPKTMDNDILFAWKSLGFQTAYEKATEYVMQLHREVSSNPRLCIVQLYGADSGFVVCHAALVSGVCDAVLFPESDFSIDEISLHIQNVLRSRAEKPYAIIVMGETFIPNDYRKYIKRSNLEEDEQKVVQKYKETEHHVYGDVDDELRSASRKIVSSVLKRDIASKLTDATRNNYWEDFRVSSIEPKWLLRSSPPNAEDFLYGKRLGILAVDNAMAGFTDFMISQWLTEYVLVPLELVVEGKKRVYKEGIFCKQVLDSTGQFGDQSKRLII